MLCSMLRSDNNHQNRYSVITSFETFLHKLCCSLQEEADCKTKEEGERATVDQITTHELEMVGQEKNYTA